MNHCRWLAVLFALGLVGPAGAKADPQNGNLTQGTSVSGAYDSRSVLTNPAALGFQTELNGTELLSAFAYGANDRLEHDTLASLSFGYLGFGFEDLSFGAGKQQRYHFGLGAPITPALYFGARYVLNRSDSPALGRYDSADLGLQWRPLQQWSVGLLANGLNQPKLSGVALPIQYVLGTSFRPMPWLEVTADIDTLSTGFAKRFGYQGMGSVEVVRGVTLSAGYHSVYQWQGGVRINFGNASVWSMVQPGRASDRVMVAGLEMASAPYRSFLQPGRVLKLTLDGSLGEQAVRGGLFGKDSPALVELLDRIEKAKKDPSYKLIVVRIEHFALGLAAAQDLHQALKEARAAGKQVEVFLGNAGVKELIIAVAANKIHMEPSAELTILGPKVERYFLKGTMDKLGIEGEFLARGEYKSAPEMFTRKDSSPISREAELEMLHQVEEAYLKLLVDERKLDPASARTLKETAVFSAHDAQLAHLVDAVDSYPEEMQRIEKHLMITDETRQHRDLLALPPRVSVITAEGDILPHGYRILSLSGHSTVTPGHMKESFKHALSDCRTKAIVLRVNSPGGEVLASDQIAAMVALADKEKPVIVSMGDVAASGGYMIAAPATRIFAEPLTLTGSIGVFLGKFNLGGFYDKIGLKKEVITSSPFADLMSEDRPWTPEERRIMVRQLNGYYDTFVSFVASHRGLTPAAAEAAAKGRVWLGEAARSRKLTDVSGGAMDAIRDAAKTVGLSGADYDVEVIEEDAGLFSLFTGDGMIKSQASAQGEVLTTLFSARALRSLAWMASVQENPFLYLAPVEITD